MITLIQHPPLHPVYEVEDETPLHKVVEFLFEEGLPEDMSLALRGSMLHFRTREERIQFGLGLQIGSGGR